MAVNSTKKVGTYGLILFFMMWIYYTIWVLIIPLFDEDIFAVQLFPPREYAILIISFCGWALIVLLSGFIGMVVIQNSFHKPFTPERKDY
ncbi:dolichol phosphate-mannose biosynthesis regulatory protein [Acrasis kona]|uniref:Dolichol phosphate-mannose biosynthesis regulatory protein n=1 Tax=Acrasis kona TaxID=1008807 RepID=A0AAW2Z0P6_9EUKA